MVAVLFAGSWVILSYGSTLHAPVDLAGKWELTPASGAVSGGVSGGVSAVEEMTVEQSGKYLNLVTPHWSGDVKLISDPANESSATLRGSGATVSFDGLSLGDTCTIRFEGPIAGSYPGAYRARRTVRAYPIKVNQPATQSVAQSVARPAPH